MESLNSAHPQVSQNRGSEPGYRILEEGRNCWRLARAGRAAFLIDAQAYFDAFARAVLNARSSIIILGWDIDSRVPLFRDGVARPQPARIGEFLNWAVSTNPGLHAYVLVWDFYMIYAFERELMPVFKLGWRTHRRLHFHSDGNHPMGASHHQKVVVIDDSVAFVGGIDLSKCRWDTSLHAADDPRRNDPGCPNYSPFHDAQMMVDGEAALALGQLARQRWFRATGGRIAPPGQSGMSTRGPRPKDHPDVWPREVVPDMENVRVAIARTQPLHGGRPEVREVETLYRDSIGAARKFIYLESQYLTSSVICEALAARLREPECPEIVIVLPRKSSGWLEEGTMDALRSRILVKLRHADQGGRLRIYYPKLPGYNGKFLNVHSKISIIDDEFARIGSSNLSNRSMGFDTECDLAFEAGDDQKLNRAIGDLRSRLLAEHLGVTREEVDAAMYRKGSLIDTIEKLRGGERTFEELDGSGVQEILDSYVYDTSLIDPECPVQPAKLVEQFVPEEVKSSGMRAAIWGVLTLVMLLGLAAAWTWTPLKQWLNLDTLLHYTAHIAGRRTAPLVVLAVYIIGGIMHFPLTLLIVATAVTFEPLRAFFYSLAGGLASAACLYWLGKVLGRDALRRFGGKRLNRLSRRLAKQGILTIIMIRIFPVGPFSLINFIAGTSHIRFRDFILGTAIGLMPGLVTITVLGERLGHSLRHPRLENFLLVAGLVMFIIAANVYVRRLIERRKAKRDTGESSEEGS